MAKPWQMAAQSKENARLCIRAAEMRARGMKWAPIAAELGLDMPMDAKRCAEAAYGLVPAEDLRTGRRVAADELDELRRELWEVVRNPGPRTTPSGAVVINPDTGEPYPDQAVKVSALNGLRAVNAAYRDLYGTDAPKQRMILNATASYEQIQAAIAQTRAEVEQAEREALGTGRDDEDDDDDGLAGVPALLPGPSGSYPPAGGSPVPPGERDGGDVQSRHAPQ